MRTTNEEKAINIRAYLTSTIMADGKTKGLNLLSERNKRCADLINIYKLVEMSALQAMQWKDKQHKREKQKLIDEVCERLEEYFAPDGSMVPENIGLWRDLQRVIKGEKL